MTNEDTVYRITMLLTWGFYYMYMNTFTYTHLILNTGILTYELLT